MDNTAPWDFRLYHDAGIQVHDDLHAELRQAILQKFDPEELKGALIETTLPRKAVRASPHNWILFNLKSRHVDKTDFGVVRLYGWLLPEPVIMK